MTGRAKRKGDDAEREVQGILRDLLGVPARRALGAGRRDDIGDITGVPELCVQVAAYADLSRAVREKLPELQVQQARMGATFAALFCRRRGGSYVVVMTPEQFAALYREAMADLRADWPVHQPEAFDAPIPGRQWYSGCDPDRPRVNPATGRCVGCGGVACPVCGLENCPDHPEARAPRSGATQEEAA